MLIDKLGANEFTIKDIEDFLNGEDEVASPTTDERESSPAAQPDTTVEQEEQKDVTETQAFARRLKEATTKARDEERDNIAKELGYENYVEMQKAKEKKLLTDKGLDPDEVSPVVEEIVQKRLAEDPRLKELDSYRQQRMQEWAKQEVAELSQLTGGRITKLADVPKNVIELWKQKGSLKAAYLELEGEKLIREMQAGIASEHSKGTTRHMQTPQGAPVLPRNDNRRPMNEKEKEIYKLFNPDVTDEELNKKLVDY